MYKVITNETYNYSSPAGVDGKKTIYSINLEDEAREQFDIDVKILKIKKAKSAYVQLIDDRGDEVDRADF